MTTITTSITTCDFCLKDLSCCEGAETYGLKLSNYSIPMKDTGVIFIDKIFIDLLCEIEGIENEG